jgi:hypothetical protein
MSTNQRPLLVRLRWLAAIAAVVSGGMATHLPYVLASDCLDADAAVVTMMGSHFAHGEIAPFLWGSRYMGALEAWALIPFSWLGGSSDLFSACIAALCLTVVQVVCVARIASRAGGQVFVAVMLLTATSALTAFAQTTLYGGRLAATTLVLLALDTIQGKPTAWRALLSGALTGAALYGDHLAIVWAMPIALAAYRNRRLGRFVSAALPWVALDRVCFALTTGPKPGVADPWEWPRNIKLLLQDGLPMLFGVDWAAAKRTDFVPPAANATWIVLSTATASLVVFAAARLARQYRTNGILDFVFVPIATAGIFVLAAYDAQSTRYLAAAWPAVAILASIAAGSRRVVGIVGAVITATNMALSVAHDTFHLHGSAAGRVCRTDLSTIANALTDAGVRGVWADYWDAYRLGLFMNERLPFAPFLGVDRRPVWARLVREASPVAYLLTDERAPLSLREALDRVGAARRVGHYDLYVLPHSLPDP